MGGCKGWDAGTRASYQNSIFSQLKSGEGTVMLILIFANIQNNNIPGVLENL